MNTNAFNGDEFSGGPSDPYGTVTTETNEYSLFGSGSSGSSTTITGAPIGGPTCFFAVPGGLPCGSPLATDLFFQTYRAEITSLVHTGANTLVVGGMNFVAADGFGNDGIGVIAVSDDGSGSTLGLVDGQDLAFCETGFEPGVDATCPRFLNPLDRTVAQTFTFPPSSTLRTATLSTLASSVEGPASGFGPQRPNQLKLLFSSPQGPLALYVDNPWPARPGRTRRRRRAGAVRRTRRR